MLIDLLMSAALQSVLKSVAKRRLRYSAIVTVNQSCIANKIE